MDTPGLDGPSLQLENDIAAVLRVLQDTTSIHLIVIAIANIPVNDDMKVAVGAYLYLFLAFNGNIIFVHTGIDYSKLYHKEDLLIRTLADKKHYLDELVGRDSSPTSNCITLNTLRDILAMAKLNQPILIEGMRMNKTERMTFVDNILSDKYATFITEREKILGHWDRTQRTLQDRIHKIHSEIFKREQMLKEIERKLDAIDSGYLELLHEEMYHQDTSELIGKPKTICFPAASLATVPGFTNRVIDHIDIRAENIEVLEQTSGIGQTCWVAKICRKAYQGGLCHKFAEKISNLKTEKTAAKGYLEETRLDIEAFTTYHSQADVADIKEVLSELQLDRYLYARSSEPDLNIKVFLALVDANVYVRHHFISAVSLEKFYGKGPKLPVVLGISSEISEEIESLGDSKYSVLLLEKTQAGKSTFVQFVKNYANPQCHISWDKIGHYAESKTGKLEKFVVRSNLPEYEVYDNNTSAPIDTHTLGQRLQNSDDYKDIVRINDTYYRDIEHAKTIIGEMVRIKSFNLIVVVINIHPAIHKEKSLAFDYYARVIEALQGHYFNVVFLYTHVKYEDCHQSNTKHQTNLQQKHKAFSYLFRERGKVTSEGEIDLKTDIKQDVELYPFYTIDHSTRGRPVVQCMIRKTIQEILQKAVWSQSVPLDASTENLERVFAIRHPDEGNQKRRERLHAGQQANLGQQRSAESVRSPAPEQEGAAVGSVEAVEAAVVGKGTRDEDTGEYYFAATSVVKYDSDSDDGEEEKGESLKKNESRAVIHKQKYSILVLGKFQAGKTALIQNIKTYANPSSTIDRSLLGDGTFFKTDKPRHFRFKSNLPTYEAFDRESGTTHNLKNLEASTTDNEDCEDSLFARENTVGLGLRPRTRFEFLDTPGFCNYKGKDVAHAESVIKAITDARSFNLVLIVVNPLDPITTDYQLALRYYSEVLYDLHTNTAFVFTHVNYALSRRSNSDGHLDLEETTR
ncbi:hypothetical protein BG006_009040 [Podila minutissima]|uniref:G domain-containing protein n=1 Tax=Podila minutissima TaxID=64525 RepID=A0A9P5SJ82_9FUNG|nr:hypothetical protein BG006_009040 [Podila minutissima]